MVMVGKSPAVTGAEGAFFAAAGVNRWQFHGLGNSW